MRGHTHTHTQRAEVKVNVFVLQNQSYCDDRVIFKMKKKQKKMMMMKWMSRLLLLHHGTLTIIDLLSPCGWQLKRRSWKKKEWQMEGRKKSGDGGIMMEEMEGNEMESHWYSKVQFKSKCELLLVYSSSVMKNQPLTDGVAVSSAAHSENHPLLVFWFDLCSNHSG